MKPPPSFSFTTTRKPHQRLTYISSSSTTNQNQVHFRHDAGQTKKMTRSTTYGEDIDEVKHQEVTRREECGGHVTAGYEHAWETGKGSAAAVVAADAITTAENC
ncbi:hypothetical protein LOAG_09959 [Loa loa]|uniref:Uncharacterized protein n=1 Tax=Loa loa TaxID=7209 RepID=A0A1S0TQU9_LOALO|nr:hypothetical protein LOAG_09959 [Loa loa]EFO18537.1 hypothetical protein LOAG_09959 [Loa loa]